MTTETGDYGKFKTVEKATIQGGTQEFTKCIYCRSLGEDRDDVRHEQGCPSTDRDLCVWCDLPRDECACESTRYVRHGKIDGRWKPTENIEDSDT
jgi:hypothetical protein